MLSQPLGYEVPGFNGTNNTGGYWVSPVRFDYLGIGTYARLNTDGTTTVSWPADVNSELQFSRRSTIRTGNQWAELPYWAMTVDSGCPYRLPEAGSTSDCATEPQPREIRRANLMKETRSKLCLEQICKQHAFWRVIEQIECLTDN